MALGAKLYKIKEQVTIFFSSVIAVACLNMIQLLEARVLCSLEAGNLFNVYTNGFVYRIIWYTGTAWRDIFKVSPGILTTFKARGERNFREQVSVKLQEEWKLAILSACSPNTPTASLVLYQEFRQGNKRYF